jgi:hypothetical protein
MTESPLARSLAPARRGRFHLRALGDFLRAELRDASDQLHGDGLGEWEPDRALADFIWCKVVFDETIPLLSRNGVVGSEDYVSVGSSASGIYALTFLRISLPFTRGM